MGNIPGTIRFGGYLKMNNLIIGIFIAIVAAILVALGVAKLSSNMYNRDNPPVSCQLLGGNWSPLTGWRCG